MGLDAIKQTLPSKTEQLLQHPASSSRIVQIFESYSMNSGVGAAGAIGLTVTSIFIHDLLWKVANTCFNAEMGTQADFNACNRPFVTALITQHCFMALFGSLCGYALHKVVAQNPIQKNRRGGFIQKAHHAFLSIEKEFRFENLLLLGYVYNGIGINVYNTDTFHAFLACSAATVGIGGALLGLYARQQLTAHIYPKEETGYTTPSSFRAFIGENSL